MLEAPSWPGVRAPLNPCWKIVAVVALSSMGQNTGINVKVTLLGGVRSQGVYHIPESTDMISLIGYAGGGNEFAKLNDITIKRRKGDSYEVLDVSLKNLATSAGSLPTPRLMNGDVVFVPESRSTQNLMLGLSIISTVLSIALAGYAVSQIKNDPSPRASLLVINDAGLTGGGAENRLFHLLSIGARWAAQRASLCSVTATRQRHRRVARQGFGTSRLEMGYRPLPIGCAALKAEPGAGAQHPPLGDGTLQQLQGSRDPRGLVHPRLLADLREKPPP